MLPVAMDRLAQNKMKTSPKALVSKVSFSSSFQEYMIVS